MSLNDKMTELMNAIRSVTGTNEQLKIDEAVNELKAVSGFVDHGDIFKGDANNLTETGIWTNRGALGHLPESGPWGVLTVYAPHKGTGYVKQEWTSANDAATFVRINVPSNGSWTAWKKLGGVRNPLLPAIKRLLTPVEGGVAYVA